MASPTAGDLRRVAEAADGLRNQDVQIVTDSTGELTYRTQMQPGDTLLFTARSENQLQRPATAGTIFSNGSVVALDGCDAVFWSEAAVEKFAWPYYEAHGIDVSDLRQAYETDARIVAIAHKLPTDAALVFAGTASLQLLTWAEYQALP